MVSNASPRMQDSVVSWKSPQLLDTVSERSARFWDKVVKEARGHRQWFPTRARGRMNGLPRGAHSLGIQLFTLRESPAARPKTATFAKRTGFRELSACVLYLGMGGRRERRLRRIARGRGRRRQQKSIPSPLRSLALGASCKPLWAIVGPVGDSLEASWALMGLSWGPFWALLGLSSLGGTGGPPGAIIEAID